jgi:hypothetical protein
MLVNITSVKKYVCHLELMLVKLSFIKASLSWYVTRCRLVVVTDVSGQHTFSIFKGQTHFFLISNFVLQFLPLRLTSHIFINIW